MPINESNIMGLLLVVCLLFIAIWQIYAKWHSYKHLQRYGHIIWATVTDIESEICTIAVGTPPIQKSEIFVSLHWKDAQSGNEQKFRLKVPDAYSPKLGERLPIRVSPDGFHTYRLDLKQLQSPSTSIPKKHQQLKEFKEYESQSYNSDEYEMPQTTYPIQMPNQQ